MSPNLNNQDKQQIEEHISNYIRNYYLEETTTDLHVAAATVEKEANDYDLIQLFLQLGSDSNAKDDDGRTPL
jgi:ankyrin repeat protein